MATMGVKGLSHSYT